MLTIQTFLFFLVLFLIAVLFEPIADKKRIPFSIILILIGFIGSEIAVKIFGIDTGIRWHNFHTIIFYIILPVFIFQAAIEIDINLLWKNIVPILILAFPLLLVSATVTAAGLYYGINHPSGFPWIAAFIAGALLSATDPAAVLSTLKNTSAPKRLSLLLEGESLFNDAMAIVLFSIFIAMAMSADQGGTWNSALVRLFSVFFGGLVVGVMIGIIAYGIIKILKTNNSHVLVTLICAYSSFIVAENFLHLSGVMAVLSAGMLIGSLGKKANHNESNQFVEEFWAFVAYIADILIFLLAGVTITLTMFTDQWLAILIGITSVIIARILVIFGVFPMINLLPRVDPIPVKHQVILAWGGIRGTVTLALALSLPLTLEYWYTIQSIAYGVVLFTLFVQATSLAPLARKLS